VTCDVENHWEEVTAFLSAVREGAVCLIGAFQTQIVHNKALFYVLRNPLTAQFLSADEVRFIEDHVPKTYLLDGNCSMLEDLLTNQERWIIKPVDNYNAHNVYAGLDANKETWRNIVRDCLGTGDYIMQEFMVPWQKTNILPTSKAGETSLFKQMTGIYLYGGKVRGILSRASEHNIIAGARGDITLATVVVET
jgi:hypothetical protein